MLTPLKQLSAQIGWRVGSVTCWRPQGSVHRTSPKHVSYCPVFQGG
jgi:hypothetical protein